MRYCSCNILKFYNFFIIFLVMASMRKWLSSGSQAPRSRIPLIIKKICNKNMQRWAVGTRFFLLGSHTLSLLALLSPLFETIDKNKWNYLPHDIIYVTFRRNKKENPLTSRQTMWFYTFALFPLSSDCANLRFLRFHATIHLLTTS